MPTPPRRPLPERAAAAIVAVLCALILAGGVGVVFLDVIFRYFLSNPLQWSDEVAIAVLVAITFLGAALALYRSEHLGMRTLRNTLIGRWADRADGFSAWVILLVSVCLTWSAVPLLESVAGQTTVSGLMPASIEYWPLPVGGAVMSYFALFQLFRVPRRGLWGLGHRRRRPGCGLSRLGMERPGLGERRHLAHAGGRCRLSGCGGAGGIRAGDRQPGLHGGHRLPPDQRVVGPRVAKGRASPDSKASSLISRRRHIDRHPRGEQRGSGAGERRVEQKH